MSTGMEIQLADVTQHSVVLEKQQEKLEKWCTGGEVRAEALIRYALAEMSTNDDLRQCTPTSIYLSLLSCAVTGLVPGKLRGFAYIVPFGNMRKDASGKEHKVQEATFMMGWRGVKHIGFRCGLDLVSAVIHEGDDFDFDKGTAPFVRYKPALKGVGAVIGSAAWAKLPRGGLEVEYLGREELEKIKQAATRIRKSPAWEGAFRDQMERKSALKRLGKQIEMGEEFFRADAIELAQDEHGHAGAALDQFTDGAATKFLAQQSTEAAVFSGAPRPAMTQVPASLPPGPSNQQTTSAKKPGSGKAAERPTSPAATSAPPAGTPSSSAAPAASPTTPTPAASTATSGKPSTPASASPAATSPSNSATTSSSNQSESSASGEPGGDQAFGDVAQEPGPDEAFDTAFGEEDPVDSQPTRTPVTRGEWLAAFDQWRDTHPTKEQVLADDSWFDLFQGWMRSCTSKAELDADVGVFKGWCSSEGIKFTFGRKADPARKLAAIAPDRQVLMMQDAFARRYKEVP